jgi:phage antirepressor YoqD-like protein
VNEIINIEHNNERVLTTEQLAQAYGCDISNIQDNYRKNQSRFEEGTHFFKLDGDELKEFKSRLPENFRSAMKFAPIIMLWTRRGASRHSKMLGTDKAWEMFDALEENYFNLRPKQLTPAEQMAQGLLAAQKLLDTTRLELAQTKQIVNELQPKASYYDLILQSKSVMSVSKIAKDFGKSAVWLNRKLEEKKVQYNQGGVWLLYQKYAEKGYTQSTSHVIDDEHSRLLTKWTQKGRLFIYDLLKGDGILPLIEQTETI